jgi:zinc protease
MVSVPHSGKTILRATLPNGLRVVIVQNRLAPVVATAVNYLVGSDEAPSGFPGTAHAQEHMMFRGSPGLSADQLADIGSAMGGNFNANTRESLTQYLYTVPSDDIDVALNIEALRMRNVNDSQADWDKERGAIEQEVAQDLSSPFYVLYANLRAEMFAGTPYEHDALGTRPSFDATTAAMLKSFHDQWYVPNNAILVIVGDIDPAATFDKVKALFGSIAAKHLPGRPIVVAPQIKPQTIDMPTDRPQAAAVVAVRMPGLNSADFPAAEVLGDILQSQRSELFNLVVSGKAITTDFSLDGLPQAGLGYAIVSYPAGGDRDEMQALLKQALQNVVRNGVTADMVEAAKLDERRQTAMQKNSIADLASEWSEALALYGLPSPEADLVRIDRVTVADVNRVAREYLDLDHAITANLIPRPSTGPVAGGGGFGGQETIALGEGQETELPTWAKATLARLRVPPATLHPTMRRLPNGITVIVQPEDVSDTVTVMGHVRNRPEVEEPRGEEGVAQLLERLFPFGTQVRDRVAFQKALDAIGANERAGSSFAIQALAGDFKAGLALLAENELKPALPSAEFELQKASLAAEIAGRNRSPTHLAQQALRQALYPPGDPLLRQATPDTIAKLSLADVKDYYTLAFRPDLTTIVVIGRVTPSVAIEEIARKFGGWSRSGETPVIDPAPAPPNSRTAVVVPDASRVQDLVTVAQNIALRRNNPDYYALTLGNAILGGGFYATRLSIDLRKQAGLVYSVNSDLQANPTRSAYAIRYASDPQNAVRAATMVGDELRKMQQDPIAPAEMTMAKALLLRQIPLAESDVNEIARTLIQNKELGVALDEQRLAAQRYLSLTGHDVQAAFRKWMRPDDLVRVIQGPAP